MLSAALLAALTFLPGMTGSYTQAAETTISRTQNVTSSKGNMYKNGTNVGKVLFPLMENAYTDHMNEVVNTGSIELYNKCYIHGIAAIAKSEVKQKENLLKSLFGGSEKKPKEYTYSLLKTDGMAAVDGSYASMVINDNKTFVTYHNKDYSQSAYYDIETGGAAFGIPVSQEPVMTLEMQQAIMAAAEQYRNDPVAYQKYMSQVMQTMKTGGGNTDIAINQDMYGKNVAVDASGNKLFDLPDGEFQPFVDGLAEYHKPVKDMNGFAKLAATFLLGGNSAEDMDTRMQDARTASRTPPKPLSYVADPFDNEYGTTLLEPIDKGPVTTRGYVNDKGKILVDKETDFAYLMRRMGTVVKNKASKQYSFITREGQTLIAPGKYEVDEKNAGIIDDRSYLIAMKDVNTKKLCILSLKDGQALTPAIYDKVTFLSQNRALVSDKSSSLLIDVTNGKVVAEFTGKKDMKPFGLEKVAWVYGQGQYQIINTNGEILYTLPSGSFKYMSSFKHGLSVVGISEDKYGIMDSQGHWVVQPIYADIRLI